MYPLKKTRPLSGRRRAVLLAFVALVLCALGGIDAGSATALGEQCSGANVTGKGAFLQSSAQSIWAGASEEGFNGSPNSLACSGKQGSGGKPKISYTAESSAYGLNAWGAFDSVFHDKGAKFIATDEPPAGPVEEEGTQLNRITHAIDSKVAVVPVTQTAIAIVAHPPMLPAHAPCTVSQITGLELEGTFSGQLTNWRQLKAASDPKAGGDCDQAITRIVREEDSGATYQFKHYLDQVESEPLECTGKSPQTWEQLQPSSGGEESPNRDWPRKADCQKGEGPVTVVATSGEGPASPIGFVAESPGTITYGGLPEAEGIAPTWILNVENGVKAASPSTKEKDANCGAAKYELPSGWESGVNVDWSQVYGSDPSIGKVESGAYPICTLTWVVAATDSFHVFGKGVATTVRNYLEYVRATEFVGSSRHGHWYMGVPSAVSEVAGVAISHIEGEEGEEGKEEEKEEEKEGEGGKGAVLCQVAPEEVEGVLTCPAGKGFAGKITGIVNPEVATTFESTAGPEGTISCDEGEFAGDFSEDGRSSPEGGVSLLWFGAPCTTTFAEKPTATVQMSNAPYDASRFIYLAPIAPQGSFVLAKSKGTQPLLGLYSSFKCFYQPTFLGGQVVNGGPTRLLLGASWKLVEGTESCPTALRQASELNLKREGGKANVYVAGE